MLKFVKGVIGLQILIEEVLYNIDMSTKAKKANDQMAYSYPIRTSTAIVVFRIIGTQLFIGLLSLLITLPIVAYKEVIDNYIPIIMLYAFIQLFIQTLDMALIVTTFLSWINLVYIIRPDEIVRQKGIWNIKESAYSTERVEQVTVYQSFWGRLFNYGTIKIYSL